MTYDNGEGSNTLSPKQKEYLGDLLTNNSIINIIEDSLRCRADKAYSEGDAKYCHEINQLIREIQFVRSK